MDASKQLVVVAFQPKGEMNLDKIRDAIYRAGYEPAHYYKWNGKFVDIIEFQKAKKLDSKRPGKSRIKALAKTPRSKSKRSKRLGK